LQYNVEWDHGKAQINLKKHGVSFELASSVFLDPRAMTIFDYEHSEYEERWVSMGIARNGTLLIICHTFIEETISSCRIRIFSARKATKSEIKSYKGQ
jgi:uncharacterized protein